MSLPDTDTVPRPRGQTFVIILNVVPSPGIFAKICLGSADHLSVLDVVSGLVPRADQSPVLDRSARQVCAQMSTPPRDREVFAVDVSDGIRSRTGHRPRGQVGNRAHCDLLCHASLQSAADGPWHVIVDLPPASCGKTPLVAGSFTSAGDRESPRMTRFLFSYPTQNRGHTPTVSLLTDSADSGHTVRDKKRDTTTWGYAAWKRRLERCLVSLVPRQHWASRLRV
jgi:hypothetical protein